MRISSETKRFQLSNEIHHKFVFLLYYFIGQWYLGKEDICAQDVKRWEQGRIVWIDYRRYSFSNS